MRSRRQPGSPAPWSRRRLRLFVLSSAMGIVLVVVTTIWTLAHVLLGASVGEGGEQRKGGPDYSGEASADAEVAAARPGPLTTARSGHIALPAATSIGESDVPTGFPRTPEGALAQLAAIDQTALTTMSLPQAQLVADQWISPGGPSPEEWSVVSAVESLLTSTGQPAEGSQLGVVVEPAMGGFRQGDALGASADADADVVTPCIDFVVSLSNLPTEQIAAADCQRMTWAGGRWVIAPGDEEQAPDSLWPGSGASVDAGWQWLVSE